MVIDIKKQGMLIVISGPSGVGKDSVLRSILDARKNVKVSISYTTRKPREGEINGRDYFFVSEDTFLSMIEHGDMLEWAEYCGNYYGTSVAQVTADLKKGYDVILEVEVQGASQVMKKAPNAVKIFMLPPSIKELKSRLIKRGTESAESTEKRILQSEHEIKLASCYNYILVNKTVAACALDIMKIIDVEHLRTARRKNIIKEVLNNENFVG